MKAKFHYEVQTIFDQKTEEVTIKTFENQDPLIARKEAFSFLKNYINILKNEGQIDVDTKPSSPRNHAQFRYDSRTENFEHSLQSYFVSKVEFKNPALQYGIKINLVLNKAIKVKNEILEVDDRFLIYQLGNYSQQSLYEMINGLVKEYEIHSRADSFIERNTSEINLTPYLYLFDEENDFQENQKILKTPFSLCLSYWEKMFSVFNKNKIFSLKLIKNTFVHQLGYEFEKLENYDFKQIYKTAASMFYTNRGLIALKINRQENDEETKRILSSLNKGLSRINNDFKLNEINYNLINCKSKSGNYFLCIHVGTYSWKRNFLHKIPTEIYYRENGSIEKIIDANEIINYLKNNFKN